MQNQHELLHRNHMQVQLLAGLIYKWIQYYIGQFKLPYMIEQIYAVKISLNLINLKNFTHKLQKLNNNQIKIFLNTHTHPKEILNKI